MVIPFVTTIISSLENEDPTQEHGVLKLKRDLKKAMQERFADIETIEEYAVSTLLDSKFKAHFFRKPDTLPFAQKLSQIGLSLFLVLRRI